MGSRRRLPILNKSADVFADMSERVLLKEYQMNKKLLLLNLVLVFCGCASTASAEDWAGYVNPFIGTVRGSGSTYPGAQTPFGMLSFSPHTDTGNHGSGYQYTCDKIKGFGLVHLSGVGCGAACELPFMPITGTLASSPVKDRNTYSSVYTHEKETASPGYYAVTLDRYDIDVALTAATRSGIGTFRYHTATEAGQMVFNPTASANGMRDGHIVIDPDQRSISGWVKGGGFCHVKENDYVIYYIAVFDKPFKDCGVWKGDEKKNGVTEIAGNDIAAYVTFDGKEPQTVTMKTGISFVSQANAVENLQTEIPDWDFEAVRTSARTEWNKALGKIQVEGGTKEEKTLFYTALYHTLQMPNIFEDVNGQYIGMDNKIYTVRPGRHAYSTFSGWDTYRTQAQLWGFLYPDAASDFCQTFLETSRQTEYKGGGGLPLWSMFNDETKIMSGYPAAPFIASAYAFGARDFDVEGLTAVMADSGKHNRYWGRNAHVTWSYLEDYKKNGYYPADCGIAYSLSQNVEYAIADFSIARMCRAVGDDENYQYFLDRSQSVFKLIHPEEKYLWPRLKDGSWKKEFDPYGKAGCQEGTSTHYTWGIPHNLGQLIQDIGGAEAAEERLDKFMSKIAFGYDYGNPYYLAGNEPCFGVVPVYNWIGRPWKAQKHMRRVMDASFRNIPKGIPGDDDSGAMSAWYVFAALGLYPEIPGVGGFAVTGPLFSRIIINLDGDRTITMNAKNAAGNAPYIHSMSLNGAPFEKTWLSIEQLTGQPKTTIDFNMSTEPNESWATGCRPPSFEPIKKTPLLNLGASEYDSAYNLAVSEIEKNIRDGYFIAGQGWSQLWTRDTAFSVELGCGLICPDASETSLRKCTEDVAGIGTCWFQDKCGHFGGWPNLSDAIVGAQGAWYFYCVSGDKNFLSWAYGITKNSLIRAERDAYDKTSGLFGGCSSFMESNSGYPKSYHNKGELVAKTKALSTNMLYYNGYRLGAKMGQELDAASEEVELLNTKADHLKKAIRKRLWLPEQGYYSYFEDENQKPVDCMEGLGESLVLLAPGFETDADRISGIFENTYRDTHGIPCLWPRWDIERRDIFSYYHNGRIWPFVQGYWALAASRHKKTEMFLEELNGLLWLSQHKNTFAEFYEFDGTFPNERRRQLWSAAGYVSMIYHGLFGMTFEPDQLRFAPVKPEFPFAETITIENVNYREMNLVIEISGSGTQIQEFKLNGIAQDQPVIPAHLEGNQKIEISLNNHR